MLPQVWDWQMVLNNWSRYLHAKFTGTQLQIWSQKLWCSDTKENTKARYHIISKINQSRLLHYGNYKRNTNNAVQIYLQDKYEILQLFMPFCRVSMYSITIPEQHVSSISSSYFGTRATNRRCYMVKKESAIVLSVVKQKGSQ